MSEYLLVLFVVLALILTALAVTWFILARPLGPTHVRLDFDHYKGREGR